MTFTYDKDKPSYVKLILYDKQHPVRFVMDPYNQESKIIQPVIYKSKDAKLIFNIQSESMHVESIIIDSCFKWFSLFFPIDMQELPTNIGTLQLKSNNKQGNEYCDDIVIYFYTDGMKIVLTKQQTVQYIRMSSMYIGLNKSGELTEIVINQLDINEIKVMQENLLT